MRLNSPEASFTLNLADACVSVGSTRRSPIDLFYASFDLVMKRLGDTAFSGDEWNRHLLLAPVFASAELYFRRYISGAIVLCPLCRDAASSQTVSLGAVSALAASVPIAIGEHIGLTSKGQIRGRTRDILGIEIKDGTSLATAILEFERVCHLRHALVHLNGELLFQSRRELKIERGGRLRLSLSTTDLQNVAAKVCNVVRSYNEHVSFEIARRWLRARHLSRAWRKDRVRFGQWLQLARSSHDLGRVKDAKAEYTALLAKLP